MKTTILAIATALIAGAQSFHVAGVLVDAQSGSPVNRAHLILGTSRADERYAVTGEDGRFSFDVPKGKYSLIAERRGSRQTFGAAGPSSTFGSAIITGPDHDTGNLVFRWYSASAIFGRVIDDRGEPVENATVQMIRESIIVGKKRLAASGYSRTDDRGNYRVGPLAGGTYYVVATGEPWYVKQLSMIANVGRDPSQPIPPEQAYAPAYFPNAADPRSAAPLVLNPGTEVQADFTLRTVTGANVHPVCLNANPEPPQPTPGAAGQFGDGVNLRVPPNRCAGAINLFLHAVGDVETLFSTTYSAFTGVISGVPPGRYSARYSGNGGAMRRIIDVSGGDVTVELAGLPQPSVRGTVAFKNPGTKPRSTIYVRLVNDSTGAALARAIEPDGSFSWKSVAPGVYRPEISGADGFYVSSFVARGADVNQGVIDLIDGVSVQLQIVASDETGRLKGFVMNGDKTVPAALVVLAPRAGSTDPYGYRGFQTELDGSFDFLNLRAGDYVLFAVERAELEYANPEVVKPYLAAGKPFRIEPHGVYTENVPVMPLAKSGTARQ